MKFKDKAIVLGILFLHNVFYAGILAIAFGGLAYLEYFIALRLGFSALKNPTWWLRLAIMFVGSLLVLVSTLYFRFKERGIGLECYNLNQNITKQMDRVAAHQALGRLLFRITNESPNRIEGTRKVGRVLKRQQVISVTFEEGFARFDVALLKTIYPIDYFLENAQVLNVLSGI